MLNGMWEFDRKMIHEKYNKVVNECEKQNIFYLLSDFYFVSYEY